MKKNCETCRFFEIYMKKEEFGDIHNSGSCRRYPPVLIDLFKNTGSFKESFCFPDTHPTDWCGEWKRKKEAI